MDQKPNLNCTVCGENDFHQKEGYYFCNECGTKTELVRAVEVEREEDFEKPIRRKTQKIKTVKSDKPELTSWECYNYILRGIVDELILMGAKDELKLMALQIWAAYLRNREVAFFSRKNAELPRLGVRFEERDVQILYNQDRLKKKRKRTESDKTSSVNSGREFRKRVKNLDQSQYESSISQSVHSASFASASSFFDSSGISSGSAPSNRAIQLKFSSLARKRLKKKMPAAHIKKHTLNFNLTCHKVRIKNSELTYNDEIMELNMKQIYAIISIALNLIEDDIQLTDLMRFIAEGHITTSTVGKFFPENVGGHCKQMLASIRLHMKKRFFGVTHMREQCSILCKTIHIRALKMPDMLMLVKRYVTELNLPTDMYTFVERLINLHPPQMQWDRRNFTPCFESRAMAYIIFTLKLLFGLDGRKEKQISRSAIRVNNQLTTMKLPNYEKLFVWDDWMQYIEMRKVILCNNSMSACKQFKHIPRREVYLQHLEECSKLIEPDVSKDQKKHQQNIEFIFQKFLDTHCKQTLRKDAEPLSFGPSFTPCHNNFKRIQLDPTINSTIPDFMRVDHSKHSLLPLLKPKKLENTFSNCGKKLSVIYLGCTSKRNVVGTFRNSVSLFNKGASSRKVCFDADEDTWKEQINIYKPAEVIFKPNMEKYCNSTLNLIRKKKLNRQGVKNPKETGPSVEFSCDKSIDLFEEDDMEPADLCLTTPRRNLESINIFDGISDHEGDTEEENEIEKSDEPTATILKISKLDCWLILGKAFELTDVQTDELKNKLPRTFFWLLETCANTLGVRWTELYDQLLVLETFFAHIIEPLDKFEDRIVFQNQCVIKDINKIARHFFPSNW